MKKYLLILTLVGAELFGAASSGGVTPARLPQYWLHTAIRNDDLDTIRKHRDRITPKLLSLKDAQGYAPLHKAIMEGDPEITKVLLNLGANIEEPTSQQPGTKKHTGGNTPLHLVLQELRRPSNAELRTNDAQDAKPKDSDRFITIIRQLLAHNANVSARNEANATPLHMLAGFLYEDLNPKDKQGVVRDKHEIQRPDLEYVARLLLAHRGPPDINAADENGNTPLHWATLHGYSDLVRTLLANGAQANAQNAQGQTALMKAAQNGYLNIMQQLLHAGANPDIQDKDKGRSALHWVQRMREGATIKRGDQMTRGRSLQAMQLLFQYGADPLLKDKVTMYNKIARSVIDWAHETANQEEIDLLHHFEPIIEPQSTASSRLPMNTASSSTGSSSSSSSSSSCSSSSASSIKPAPTGFRAMMQAAKLKREAGEESSRRLSSNSPTPTPILRKPAPVPISRISGQPTASVFHPSTQSIGATTESAPTGFRALMQAARLRREAEEESSRRLSSNSPAPTPILRKPAPVPISRISGQPTASVFHPSTQSIGATTESAPTGFRALMQAARLRRDAEEMHVSR